MRKFKNDPNEINPTEKTCYGCQERFAIDNFNKCKTGVYGLHNHCRSCQKETKRKYYLNNTEKEKAAASKYAKTEQAQRKRKEYWEENKDELKKKNNKLRRTPEARAKARVQRAKWMEIPHNRISCNLRSRIRKAIIGIGKAATTEELLGISFELFKKYLEGLFSEDMSWENYGEWHLDHIKPCASFDLSNPEEQKKCFYYTNLQPLWGPDNLSKGSQY